MFPKTVQPGTDRWVGDQEPRGDDGHGSEPRRGGGRRKRRRHRFLRGAGTGGVGLIVTGVCRVMDGAGASEPCQLASRNLADVPGLGRLMDTVHRYGARMFIQLQHPGRQGSVAVGGEQPVSASAVANPITGEAPRSLTVAEIGKIQEAFVNRGAPGADSGR